LNLIISLDRRSL